MEKKTKTNKLPPGRLLALLLLVVGSMGLGFLLGKILLQGTEGPLATVLALGTLVLSLIVAVPLQVLVHEAGHLCFGLLSGYSLSSFRIGSLHLCRDEKTGKWCIRRLSILGTAGQCLMAPPVPKEGRIPYVLYHLGGVLFNLLFGVLCLGLYRMAAAVPYLSVLLLVMALVGFFSALINGLPLHLGGVDNDGRNVLSLSRSPEALYAFYLQMQINDHISRGARLRELPGEWFAVPSDAARDNGMVAALAVFACNRQMDLGNHSSAKEQILHILAQPRGTVGLHLSLLRCDLMFLYCLEGAWEQAQALYDREQAAFMKAMGGFPTVLRTRYAMARLCPDGKESAQQILRAFEKCEKTYPNKGDMESERELLMLVDEACKSK